MNKENLMTLKDCMLEVLDNPKEKRIIVETCIPNLARIDEQVYYMIDKTYGCGEEVIEGTEWYVTNSEEVGTQAPENQAVILLFSQFPDECIERIYVESY